MPQASVLRAPQATAFVPAVRPAALCPFSDGDVITRGGERQFFGQAPGTAEREHPTTPGAGHFLHQDNGPELAGVVAHFIASTRAIGPAGREGSSPGPSGSPPTEGRSGSWTRVSVLRGSEPAGPYPKDAKT
jgi:haloalkane dehalogenase